MATVLQRWARVQQRRPMITTIVTGCTVMFCGDLAAQTYEGEHETGYDLPRLAIGTTWQGAIAAPLFGSWFRLLDQTVKAVGLRGAVAKTVANQLVSPLPVNAGYMVFSTSCEALAHNRFHEQQVWADVRGPSGLCPRAGANSQRRRVAPRLNIASRTTSSRSSSTLPSSGSR
jgi:hypothetical protein